MAFLVVLAVFIAVVCPAVWSEKEARKNAAFRVLDRILPGRSTRERDLSYVIRKAIDEYIERHKDDPNGD